MLDSHTWSNCFSISNLLLWHWPWATDLILVFVMFSNHEPFKSLKNWKGLCFSSLWRDWTFLYQDFDKLTTEDNRIIGTSLHRLSFNKIVCVDYAFWTLCIMCKKTSSLTAQVFNAMQLQVWRHMFFAAWLTTVNRCHNYSRWRQRHHYAGLAQNITHHTHGVTRPPSGRLGDLVILLYLN